MYISHLKQCVLLSIFALCLTILSSCSSDLTTSTGPKPTSTVIAPHTTVVATVNIVPTSSASTPGTGPIIILSPTPVTGGGANSQQAVLADRTLIVNSISKGSGTDASSTAITLSLTLKNTGTQSFTNEPAYYSLFGSEGDVFGLANDTTGSFFGTINAGTSLSGQVVFQVPTAATSSLKLFYRPDTANIAVFLPITV